MRNISISILLIFLCTFSAEAQNDPQAISILDKFSAKASSASSVSMKFLFIKNDQLKNSVDTVAGSLVMSKDSYKLELPENIIWYNGQTSWSFLPAENEVTISQPEKKDNSFESRPSLIFNMYKEGYKCRLLEEKNNIYLIDLYPTDVKNDIIRVRLAIEKTTLSLKSFEYKMRTGVTITIIMTDYTLSKTTAEGMFQFDVQKHKGVEIVDMR
jgi:outer membrane lipoprotein carrier protein